MLPEPLNSVFSIHMKTYVPTASKQCFFLSYENIRSYSIQEHVFSIHMKNVFPPLMIFGRSRRVSWNLPRVEPIQKSFKFNYKHRDFRNSHFAWGGTNLEPPTRFSQNTLPRASKQCFLEILITRGAEPIWNQSWNLEPKLEPKKKRSQSLQDTIFSIHWKPHQKYKNKNLV